MSKFVPQKSKQRGGPSRSRGAKGWRNAGQPRATQGARLELGEQARGLVVGRVGPVYRVRILEGAPPADQEGLEAPQVDLEGRQIFDCIARRDGKSAVIGDQVHLHWEHSDLAQGLITRVEERRNALVRADALNRAPQTLAANLDRIWVVCAAEPPPKRGLIDRYLVAAHAQGIEAGVVFNKLDLVHGEEALEDVEDLMLPYELLELPTFMVSAEDGRGLEALREALSGERSVFVGHSGVGKTSLLNALIPELNEETGALSESTGKGQHTTTGSTLYPLEGGGELIDSPGIRAFGLWKMPSKELKDHFPEFLEFAADCRFHNCLHLEEPSCAIRDAVERDELSIDRYEAYLRIYDDLLDEGL